MISLKNEKGVTLLTLLIYILLTIIALAMLTVISSHFRDNLKNLDSDSLKNSEFDKINLQLLQEFKIGNNFLDTEQTTNTKIVFTNGSVYNYEENTIYLNDNIKISEGIEYFNVEFNEDFLIVTVQISGKQKDFQYAIDKCIEHNYDENRICTLCGFKAGVYATLYSDGDLRFNSTGKINGDKIAEGYTIIAQSDDISEIDYSGDKDVAEYYGNRAWHNDRESITTVTFEEVVVPKSTTDYWFRELVNLKDINCLEYLNTGDVTSMSAMFYKCQNLTELEINRFDTSNVISMASMFFECKKIVNFDFSSFNTSNVQNFSYMFYGCENLTELDLSSFDTSNGKTFVRMFSYTSNLKSLDITHFNTSKATNMERMFNSCGLTILDLSSFDTTNVTNMKKMFSNNSNLIKIYVGDKWTTESVDHSSITDDEQPFLGCTKLVGGAGTTYDSTCVDISYARVDGGPDSTTPGYLTLISTN